MPYDLRIVRSQEFVRLDAEGHFDLGTTRTLFLDVMWTCSRSRIGRVLLDVRDATAQLTAAQLCALASAASEVSAPSGDHKIAILTRPEYQFDRASLVVTAVQGNGWNIAAFDSFECAFEWLIN